LRSRQAAANPPAMRRLAGMESPRTLEGAACIVRAVIALAYAHRENTTRAACAKELAPASRRAGRDASAPRTRGSPHGRICRKCPDYPASGAQDRLANFWARSLRPPRGIFRITRIACVSAFASIQPPANHAARDGISCRSCGISHDRARRTYWACRFVDVPNAAGCCAPVRRESPQTACRTRKACFWGLGGLPLFSGCLS
jgi:hypothetical protein